MLIGIVGDTHNNLKNISKICNIFNSENVNLVFHTGDISLPKSLMAFKDLKCKLIAVFGNNDIGEKDGLKKISRQLNFNINDEPYNLDIENTRICLLHHPELISDSLIDQSDIILHGHTHRYRNEIIRNTLIFNPGECAGFMPNKNQVGIIDLSNNSPRIVNF